MSPLPSVPTTYNSTGDPFTTATAPYAVGGSVPGSITVANPPLMPLTDLTTGGTATEGTWIGAAAAGAAIPALDGTALALLAGLLAFAGWYLARSS